MARDITRAGNDFDIWVISPRNHFLFTPLLPSTTVGTLEFRCIIEPIRRLGPSLHYYQANCTSIDIKNNAIEAEEYELLPCFINKIDCILKGNFVFHMISLSLQLVLYQTLLEFLVCIYSHMRTDKFVGVGEHCHFLKQLQHARAIRNRIIECFERASEPSCSEAVCVHRL